MKMFRKQEGFTLIELMIVVAIIGILAAIAIPNFLQYQMKGRQSEAKTNLQAIKTSEVAFQGERGCYMGIPPEGSPATAAKSNPVVWGVGAPAVGTPATAWCAPAGGTFVGAFNDIGFRATGSVMFVYAVDGTTLGAGIAGTYHPQGLGGASNSCTAAIAGATGTAALGNNNFFVHAKSNLDGDGAAGISTWVSSVDHGAADCTPGVY